MEEVSFRGGASIGWANASYPFAKLTCRRDRLMLSSLQRCEFTADQVVSLQTRGGLTFGSGGIRIVHNRRDYPEKVTFQVLGSSPHVLKEIKRLGFVPTGTAIARPGGPPIKWLVLIGAIVIWNAMFFMDFGFTLLTPGHEVKPGKWTYGLFALLFAMPTLLKRSTSLQRAALRPGRDIGEIKAFLTFMQLGSVFMAFIFGAAFVS